MGTALSLKSCSCLQFVTHQKTVWQPQPWELQFQINGIFEVCQWLNICRVQCHECNSGWCINILTFFLIRATWATSSMWINTWNIASLASELVLERRTFISHLHWQFRTVGGDIHVEVFCWKQNSWMVVYRMLSLCFK